MKTLKDLDLVGMRKIGDIVAKYFKLLEDNDLVSAEKYLKEWIGEDIPTHEKQLLFTLEYFNNKKFKAYQKKKGYNVIYTTKLLLDKIKKDLLK